MSTLNYSDKTISCWNARFEALIRDYSKLKDISPHFGVENEKTHATNEGTLPLVTCAKCAAQAGGCAHSCYAVRVCMYSREAMECYAKNTVYRRRYASFYYLRAFATAFASGSILRLNESGDFETVKQFKLACAAAGQYKTVKCIGYTHRREIASLLKSAPKNMMIRYSTWNVAENVEWAKKNRVPFAAVYKDPKKFQGATQCPSQVRKEENDKRISEGLDPLPTWTCAACAAAGIGCANRKKNIVFKLH